ncbi:hypothetical protein N7474_002726 [Penicillium riverlandense]|uniref:uncharacterized protein n=1 Tax=Penicillium riverlandense TaxID=1903569 RepID=UPI002548BBF3|nr:uncharacterized protein N7474_002726 [Penicillium riverlandense]KAJ5825588.1 hypothetical protein N7474_002726 [Penicillium riverlandense]
MGRINEGFGALYVGVAAAMYFKPEYAFYDSRTVTVAVLFSILTVSRILYQVVLLLTGHGFTNFLQAPYQRMLEWNKTIPNDGLIRFYGIGNLERVLLTSPKALSELLVTKVYDFEKPEPVRNNLRRVTGEGILLAEGDEHKFQRKNLMPAFAYRHIKDLYPIFWAKSVEMVKRINMDLAQRKPHEEDNTVQIRNWASRATLDIIGVAGMDHDFDSLRDPSNPLSLGYKKIFTPPGFFTKILIVISILLIPGKYIQKLPTKRNRDINEGGETIRNVARMTIGEKKEKMKDPDAQQSVDIISVALRSGTFDEENLVDQLMTFLGAGHETTATALQWAVYALCKNPDVQTRLREEVRANLPPVSTENPEPITASMLDNLPYLNAVCNEVLRFHPSVPATLREASRDTSLVGHPIPKGTILIISPEVTNHTKELWGPDADKFNPDRFMSPGKANTGGATSNYAFLTFLHGPRSCIGQRFAQSELACLLAAMVGRFQMELKFPDAKLEVREGATVSPKDGVLAKLTPLEGW